MSTTSFRDANGNVVSIENPLTPGRAAAGSSKPVALSNEDKTVLDSIDTKLTTTNSTLTTQNGYLDGLEALVTSTNTAIGTTNTTLTSTNTKLDTANTEIGATNETAPASDTATSGLNGRLQRIAQRITSLIALLPSALGAQAAGSSLSVVPATSATFPNTQKQSAYGTNTNVLSTELNSLANNANTALGTAYDNSSNKDTWCDILLVLAAQGVARSSGASIGVFMCPRTDGTNFDDANETTAELVAVFPLDAATTARRRTVRRVSLPPEQVKFFARNLTGQSLAASANTISIRVYNDTAV